VRTGEDDAKTEGVKQTMFFDRNAKTIIAIVTLVAASFLTTNHIIQSDPADEWGIAGLLAAISLGFWVWMWREDVGAETSALVVQDEAILPQAQEWIISKDTATDEEGNVVDNVLDPSSSTKVFEEESEAEPADEITEPETPGTPADTDDIPAPDMDVDERGEVIDEVEEAGDDASVVEKAMNDDPIAEAEIAEAEAAKPTGDTEAKAEENGEIIQEEIVADTLETKDESTSEDDLTVIEGIGPKYRDALVAAGIDTFEKVANADVTDFVAAAEAADMRRASSMESWAQQAEFAAKGDWDGLATFQDDLTAGRLTDDN
jgi:predicted flap endonuclease-1-like 5' DNA nuclease